jgi:hypothetical protein
MDPHRGRRASPQAPPRRGARACAGANRRAPAGSPRRGSSWPQSRRIVQRKRRLASNVGSMMVLGARRDGAGLRCGLPGAGRRVVPFVLGGLGVAPRSSILCGQNDPTSLCIASLCIVSRKRSGRFMRTLTTTPAELRQADHKALIAWERSIRETEQAAASTIHGLEAFSSLSKHLAGHDHATSNLVREVERSAINRDEGSAPGFSKVQVRKCSKLQGSRRSPCCMIVRSSPSVYRSGNGPLRSLRSNLAIYSRTGPSVGCACHARTAGARRVRDQSAHNRTSSTQAQRQASERAPTHGPHTRSTVSCANTLGLNHGYARDIHHDSAPKLRPGRRRAAEGHRTS